MAETQKQKRRDAWEERLLELAFKGADQIEAFFTYQGMNDTYEKKGKMGGRVVTDYVRLRGTQASEESLRQASERRMKVSLTHPRSQ